MPTATECTPSAAPAPSWPGGLTGREVEIASLIARGYERSEIASALDIDEKTVDTHRGRALKKLGIASSVALARWAIREGLVSGAEAADAPGCTRRGASS